MKFIGMILLIIGVVMGVNAMADPGESVAQVAWFAKWALITGLPGLLFYLLGVRRSKRKMEEKMEDLIRTKNAV